MKHVQQNNRSSLDGIVLPSLLRQGPHSWHAQNSLLHGLGKSVAIEVLLAEPVPKAPKKFAAGPCTEPLVPKGPHKFCYIIVIKAQD